MQRTYHGREHDEHKEEDTIFFFLIQHSLRKRVRKVKDKTRERMESHIL